MGQYLLEEIWAQEWRYFNNISYLGAQKAPIFREYKIKIYQNDYIQAWIIFWKYST